MAVDVTLIVIGKAPTFVSAHAEGQYQKGDIFDALRTAKLGAAAPAFNRKFIWIHITGVPVTAIRKAKFLAKPSFDPAFPEDDEVMLSRRRWRVLLDDLPAGVKATLLAERQITVTWEQAKPFIKDHVEDRSISDGDLA